MNLGDNHMRNKKLDIFTIIGLIIYVTFFIINRFIISVNHTMYVVALLLAILLMIYGAINSRKSK